MKTRLWTKLMFVAAGAALASGPKPAAAEAPPFAFEFESGASGLALEADGGIVTGDGPCTVFLQRDGRPQPHATNNCGVWPQAIAVCPNGDIVVSGGAGVVLSTTEGECIWLRTRAADGVTVGADGNILRNG